MDPAWFVGAAPRAHVEQVMLKAETGAFVVRESETMAGVGPTPS